MRAVLSPLLVLGLLACRDPAPAPASVPGPVRDARATDARATDARATDARATDARGTDAAPPPPEPHAAAPAATACASNRDCVVVSLGCCHARPVNRAHAAAALRALQASGLDYCPPKTACGPGTDGAWAGVTGVCRAGTCRMPAAR